MADKKDMETGMAPEDNPQSLDEMLDKIIDDEIENNDKASASPEIESPTVDIADPEVKDAAAEELPGTMEINTFLSSEGTLSPEEQAAQQKKRQIMWTVFGIAIILAIILPAGYVFLQARNIASNTTQQQATIIPVKNTETKSSTETTSTEATKTAVVTDNSNGKPANREVELEEWNYYVNGFNIFAPAKGRRVKGVDGINPAYKATVYDALDVYINKANGVQISIPVFAGDETDSETAATTGDGTGGNTPPPSDNTSISTSGGTTLTKVTRIYLDAIGSNANNKVAVWAVGKTSYQTTVGEMIGKTGWKVVKITDTAATIKNGSKTYTLRVGGSAAK